MPHRSRRGRAAWRACMKTTNQTNKFTKNNMKKNLLTIVAIAMAMMFAGTASAKSPKQKTAKAKAQHVVLIGIDGWGAYSVPKAHDIPNIKYFMDNGCYTLTDRSVLPSASAINWASMFMGLPTEMHGYTQWNSKRPEIPSAVTNAHDMPTTIFSVVREQMPTAETGCLFEWDGIKHLVDTLAISHIEQADEKKANDLVDKAAAYIKARKPQFVAVCFDQVDHTGHGDGHDTPAYYNTLASVDRQIGIVMQAVKDAGLWDNTIFVLTADHGGINKGHGGKTLQEMQIPFIICGKGVKKGGRIGESMMQYDCAATIAEALGLQRPQTWRGVPAFSAFDK